MTILYVCDAYACRGWSFIGPDKHKVIFVVIHQKLLSVTKCRLFAVWKVSYQEWEVYIVQSLT